MEQFPGLTWLVGLLDDATQTARLRVAADMMLFRKSLHTLEGVIGELGADGFSIEEALLVRVRSPLWPRMAATLVHRSELRACLPRGSRMPTSLETLLEFAAHGGSLLASGMAGSVSKPADQRSVAIGHEHDLRGAVQWRLQSPSAHLMGTIEVQQIRTVVPSEHTRVKERRKAANCQALACRVYSRKVVECIIKELQNCRT